MYLTIYVTVAMWTEKVIELHGKLESFKVRGPAPAPPASPPGPPARGPTKRSRVLHNLTRVNNSEVEWGVGGGGGRHQRSQAGACPRDGCVQAFKGEGEVHEGAPGQGDVGKGEGGPRSNAACRC